MKLNAALASGTRRASACRQKAHDESHGRRFYAVQKGLSRIIRMILRVAKENLHPTDWMEVYWKAWAGVSLPLKLLFLTLIAVLALKWACPYVLEIVLAVTALYPQVVKLAQKR